MQSMLTLWSEMLFWQCAFGYIPSQPPQQQIIGPAHYQDRGVDPIKHIYWQTKHLICTCAFKCVAFRTLLVTLVKVHLCFIIMILGNRFYSLLQVNMSTGRGTKKRPIIARFSKKFESSNNFWFLVSNARWVKQTYYRPAKS